MTENTVQAYVTKDGEVLPSSYLEQYAVAKNGPHSQQITEDRFNGAYTVDGLVEPIYNLEMLAQLLDLSTYHLRAVKTKAHDIAGLGWTLEAVDGVKDPSEDEKARATALLDTIHPELSLTELLDQFMVDYEATGQGYLEVLKDDAGVVTGLEHVPAHTIRVHSSNKKFQQRRGNEKVWFARYGAAPVDPATGEAAAGNTVANELINLKSYSPQSDYYGVPDVIPALGAILGDVKRQEYNISFFDNHAIPAYAVTVTGSNLDEDTKGKIRQFFQQDVKESRHSTLVLSAEHPEGPDAKPVSFHFEKLSTEVKEVSFTMFRHENRDEILSAHGVPPYRAGVVIEGTLGGSSANETTEIYKQSIVNPRKRRVEDRLTRVLLADGLGVTDWRIVLGELDTRDIDREVERMKILFEMGYYTPNGMREHWGEEPSTQPGMDQHYINGRLVGDTNDDTVTDITRSMTDLHRTWATLDMAESERHADN